MTKPMETDMTIIAALLLMLCAAASAILFFVPPPDYRDRSLLVIALSLMVASVATVMGLRILAAVAGALVPLLAAAWAEREHFSAWIYLALALIVPALMLARAG